MRFILGFLLLTSTIACAEQKDLASVWRESSGQTLDLTKAVPYVASPGTFTLTDGAKCECLATMNGDAGGGSYSMSHCVYKGGGEGDPACGYLAASGSYSKTKINLRLCWTQQCVAYD